MKKFWAVLFPDGHALPCGSVPVMYSWFPATGVMNCTCAAREQGWSWQQIANLLHVSKQALHQKYGENRRRASRRSR